MGGRRKQKQIINIVLIGTPIYADAVEMDREGVSNESNERGNERNGEWNIEEKKTGMGRDREIDR